MKLQILDFGRLAFEPAFERQERLVRARQDGDADDTLILVEHDPVYTLGRNADPANVLLPAKQRAERGIRLLRTTRGGQVTYHGPGQLVGYPVLKLAPDAGHGVLWYVSQLEKVLIAVLARFGLEGRTDPVNRGVWIGDAKVAALGVRVSRQVTMHGFALNVNVDLRGYEGIVPCGIRGRGVASLHLFLPGITVSDVKPVLIGEFSGIFGYACA